MIKEKFKEWLFSEPERRQKYVEYYNETFNNIRCLLYTSYKEVDGLLYPQIEMPDETEDLTKLGKYGSCLLYTSRCV